VPVGVGIYNDLALYNVKFQGKFASEIVRLLILTSSDPRVIANNSTYETGRQSDDEESDRTMAQVI